MEMKAHGEEDCADAVSAEQWKSTKLPNLLQKFCADGIYNANETGLFYPALMGSSLSYNHALFGSKKAMDRVSVLCCSNMSGTDEHMLLVIGKRAKPWCFKGIGMDSLPLLYYANKNMWITHEILLVLDNFAAHPHLNPLYNIQLEFLSPSTTSLVQQMDMGIIKNLKTLYCTKLVNYIFEAIQENLLTSSTAKKVSARIDLLQTVQFIADSWRIVSTKTIQNCSAHCCFKH
jgi:hypothetical protein